VPVGLSNKPLARPGMHPGGEDNRWRAGPLSAEPLGEQVMSARRSVPDEVYAIVRWDGFQGAAARPEALVTVKEIVRGRQQAEAEVARLNALAEGRDVRYWRQVTRLVAES
jgi:hypothetical protein